MREITERAFAKLNLSLDVVSRLPDGYHELRMVMQSVTLCDEITITLREDGVVRTASDLRYLPSDDRNIAVRAAKAFFAKMELPGLGADIAITKRIPVCSGMGGGSSDGAAVLRALNKLLDCGLSLGELEKMGADLGSDIPFCVGGGTALAGGRGEILTDVTALPPCHIVICKPAFSISTPELFGKIDSRNQGYRPDTLGMLCCLEERDLKGAARRMYNVFEDVLPQKPDDVPKIKSLLLGFGALGAAMTGTGSAVFGIFDSAEKAASAKSELDTRYAEVFSAQPVKKIEI
ncbi:MAG: 4-(cytidine 5'-diphospho)-2-C-methyl-D-erythritol kinase [Oscillospiraceae bacterium]